MTGMMKLPMRSLMRMLSSLRAGSMTNLRVSLTPTPKSLRSGMMKRTVTGLAQPSLTPSAPTLPGVVSGRGP